MTTAVVPDGGLTGLGGYLLGLDATGEELIYTSCVHRARHRGQKTYPMGYGSMVAAVLLCCGLVPVHRAAAFMLPSSGARLVQSYGRRSSGSRSVATHNVLGTYAGTRTSVKPFRTAKAAVGCAWEMRQPSFVGPLSAVSERNGNNNGGAPTDSGSSNSSSGKSQPKAVVYAQEVLDRAWRSKRRIAAQAKSKPLRQRFMNAFGGRSAIFVDDREFMEETLDNVLRIYCTHNMPNWSLPWQRLKQEQSTSTGFVIDGRRIITNAHAVEYSTMIQVRRRGCDRKFQASRYAVGEECDLAILTVEDEEFWEGAAPLAFGELPELTDDVSVIGYPVGGECISITAGVVSRVEMTVYAQAEQELLSIQIDAAINPGNSGGPVVNDDGEVVGVAFQSLDGSDVENIGYVVPVNVLEHFLEDVRRHDGRYLGFPRLGITHQHLESPALRGSLRMSPQQTGVMITGVQPTYPAVNVLRKGDVIMKVDGIRVANDGSIPFRAGERVALKYYMSQLFPEDKTEVELLRDDSVMSVTVPLSVSDVLCPVHFGGRAPSYFVLGGLVFTVMSAPYLEHEIDEGAGGLAHLLSTAEHGVRASNDEDIVILTQVLAHEVNVGYEGFSNMQLLSFNGESVKSLRHLVRLADANRQEFLRFELFRDRLIVLEAAGVPDATTQICKDNSIPSPRSSDLVFDPADSRTTAPAVAEDDMMVPPASEEEEEEEVEDPAQRQPRSVGVNGGKPPRQPSIPGTVVPVRRKPGGRAGEGGTAARRAEPRRDSGKKRGARLRSAVAAAFRRAGASAVAVGGWRIEGRELLPRWRTGAKRRSRGGGGESGERKRRTRKLAEGGRS